MAEACNKEAASVCGIEKLEDDAIANCVHHNNEPEMILEENHYQIDGNVKVNESEKIVKSSENTNADQDPSDQSLNNFFIDLNQLDSSEKQESNGEFGSQETTDIVTATNVAREVSNESTNSTFQKTVVPEDFVEIDTQVLFPTEIGTNICDTNTTQVINTTTNIYATENATEMITEKNKAAHFENEAEVSSEQNASHDGTEMITKPLDIKSEPESIIQWRKEYADQIKQRDETSVVQQKEWYEKGKTQLELWNKNYIEVVEKTKIANKQANEAFENQTSREKDKIGFTSIEVSTKTADAERSELSVWEYVAKLCDLSPNNRNIKSDVSRMRSLMLQLKREGSQGPKTTIRV